MLRELSPTFELGGWHVAVDLNRLEREGRAVVLEPKVMDLLTCLARHAGETVSKELLLEEVWGGSFIADGVIAKNVSALRRALGDDPHSPRYILTVPRRGYRLLATVRPAVGASTAGPEAVTVDAALPAAVPGGAALALGRRRLAAAAGAVGLAALAALAIGLRRESSPPAPVPLHIDRLAVLPFENGTGRSDDAFLVHGVQEEVIDELARFARPRVILIPPEQIARSGAFKSGREVRADALLTARVEVSRPELRVTVRLVAPDTGEVLWSSAHQHRLADLPELERRLAAEVVEQTRRELGEIARKRLEEERRVDPRAYQEYLKARWFWSRRGIEDLARSRGLFVRATELDPSFAEGFAGLALCFVTEANYGLEPVARGQALAAAAAERALRLDPESPEALTAVGLVRLNRDWNFAGAIAAYRRAIEIAPGSVPARQLLAEALSIVGRHDEAVTTIDEALALEPYSALLLAVRGLVLHAAGRPQEALASFDQALLFDPRFSWIHRYRADALIRLGRPQEAAQARVDEARAQGAGREELAALERRIAAEGLDGFWRWQLERLANVTDSSYAGEEMLRAEAFASLGRDREALAWLARAVRERGEYPLHVRRSPAFDHLRRDPRYLALLAPYGLRD